MIKNVCWSSRNVPFIPFRIFKMKHGFSHQIFEKFSNIKFNESPPSGSQGVPCGQTEKRTDGGIDKHDEANGRFSQIFEHAYKPIVDCGIGKSQCLFPYIHTKHINTLWAECRILKR